VPQTVTPTGKPQIDKPPMRAGAREETSMTAIGITSHKTHWHESRAELVAKFKTAT
jgi:hypothetical protein